MKYNEIDDTATEQKKQNYFINLFDDVLDEDNPFNDTVETEDIFVDENLLDDTDQKEIKKISEDVLQDTNLDQDEALFVDLPEEWPEKVKITAKKITSNARLEMVANRIKKRYQRQKQIKGRLKKANKKTTEWLKKVGYLETDDLETVDYNNDINLDDVQTADYNNDTQLDELDSEPEQIVPKIFQHKKQPKE